jgi:hypothetical protein
VSAESSTGIGSRIRQLAFDDIPLRAADPTTPSGSRALSLRTDETLDRIHSGLCGEEGKLTTRAERPIIRDHQVFSLDTDD